LPNADAVDLCVTQIHATGLALSDPRVVAYAGPISMLQRKLCSVPSDEMMAMPIFLALSRLPRLAPSSQDREQIGFHIDALVFQDDCCRAASKQWRAFIWRDA
jgi:hypothetical protein